MVNSTTLVIKAAHMRHIAEASRRSLPAEACGLLIGRYEAASAIVEDILLAANILADRRADRFEIDPRTLLRAHRAARESGRALIGHFHSHPNGVAAPSATDAEWADEAGAVWLIHAPDGETRAYRAEQAGPLHGRFAPLDLRILPD